MKHAEMSLLTAFGTVEEELSSIKILERHAKEKKDSTRLHALTVAGISPLLSTLSMTWPLRMCERPSDALPGCL
ncbi:hypothetical protein ACHAW6_000921 [Cyclotella cf. meneghiniana]